MITNAGRIRRPLLKIGGLVIAALVLAGCSIGQTDTAAPQRTASLTRGTLVASVNATGSLQPEAELKIGFEQSGMVTQVNVNAGDAVKQGDILAALDAIDLELALAQAQAALITANAGYSRTIEGAREADVMAAEAAVSAALANYTKVKNGPLPEDYADSEAALRNAEATLRQAQNIYNAAYAANPAGINGSPAAVQLEQATNGYNAAKARFDRVARSADNAQLASAWQQVESARASLDRLQQPTRVYDLNQADAQRRQAQAQVELAQRRLERAALVAPRDGIVSAVNVRVGEAVATQPVITLVDLSVLHIDISVDEIDIARIADGQEVLITLDALPGVELKGSIDSIAPTPNTISGVVSYPVRVVIIASDAPLKSGMTANTSVVLERRENVLLAPNWALRRDRSTGKSYLTIPADDQTSKEVEVTIGLRNETFTEIVSGAETGQVILAPQTSLFSQ